MFGIPAKKSRDRLDNALLIDVPQVGGTATYFCSRRDHRGAATMSSRSGRGLRLGIDQLRLDLGLRGDVPVFGFLLRLAARALARQKMPHGLKPILHCCPHEAGKACKGNEDARPTSNILHVLRCCDPTSFRPFWWVVTRLAIQQPSLWLSPLFVGFGAKRQKRLHGAQPRMALPSAITVWAAVYVFMSSARNLARGCCIRG